jgi:hypothetical protein
MLNEIVGNSLPWLTVRGISDNTTDIRVVRQLLSNRKASSVARSYVIVELRHVYVRRIYLVAIVP